MIQQPKNIVLDTQMQQTQSSLTVGSECLVKSKYCGIWTKRDICVHLEKQILQLTDQDTGKKKVFSLNQLSYTHDPQDKIVRLTVSKNRCYQIINNNSFKATLEQLHYFQQYKRFGAFLHEQSIPKPHTLTYNNSLKTLEKSSEPTQQNKIKTAKSFEEFEREPSYIKLTDWQKDNRNGGLIFINKNKKHIMGQMISYSAKQVVKSGSMKNLSFPTFAMKPESTLQTYCKCLGAAPLVLQKAKEEPIDRMKAFNVVILSMSLLYNDLDRSFTPLLGETFQGCIGGFPVYAQQISSNPPVSYFLLFGSNYKLYGHLELGVQTGLNEVVGLLKGQITVQFNDGSIIKGIMPRGGMSGILIGETKFMPDGAVYSYDPINKFISSYEVKKKDIMTGYIGRLKPHAWKKFQHYAKKQKVNKQSFKHISQKQFQFVTSKIQVSFTQGISYDNKIYFSYNDKNNLPFKLSHNLYTRNQKLLPSDSSFRKDIKIRAMSYMQQSQLQNDKLNEQEQRLNQIRKLKS